MSDNKHTSLPWIVLSTSDIGTIITDAKTKQEVIAKCHKEANAEFIVRAVNNFEELLEAWGEAKNCKRWKAGDGICCACAERINSILTQTEGKL